MGVLNLKVLRLEVSIFLGGLKTLVSHDLLKGKPCPLFPKNIVAKAFDFLGLFLVWG